MEQTPKTSFIPKQAVGVAKTRERRSFNVFTLLAMIGLLSVLTLSAGLFFYQEYATRNLEAQKAGLASFKSRFDTSAADDIREIKLLEDRFVLAKDLLDKHLAVSELFYALEDRIQENAQIKSFSFTRGESGSAQVMLTGEALSFNTLALQKRELIAESSFKDGSLALTKIDVTEAEEGGDERVTFEVLADVAIDRIKYEAEVASSAATSTATTTPMTTTTGTTTIKVITEEAPTQ